jgi:hypothetical protein
LLLEEDFAAGTIAVISLNEMIPEMEDDIGVRYHPETSCSSGTKPSSVVRIERR